MNRKTLRVTLSANSKNCNDVMNDVTSCRVQKKSRCRVQRTVFKCVLINCSNKNEIKSFLDFYSDLVTNRLPCDVKKCQIYSSSYLRYTPLNQSAHVVDTLFTHDTTWRHLWRHYFFLFCYENKSWHFLNLRWTGFIMILLSCFILMIKEVTAHQ